MEKRAKEKGALAEKEKARRDKRNSLSLASNIEGAAGFMEVNGPDETGCIFGLIKHEALALLELLEEIFHGDDIWKPDPGRIGKAPEAEAGQ